MKPTVLGLMIAAGAFAGSTIYLARQLGEERARADQVLAESRALHDRIAELERLRSEIALARQANGSESVPSSRGEDADERSSAVDHDVPSMAVGDTTPAAVAAMPRPPGGAMLPPMPERSEAFQRMMRGQIRAHNRQLYADLGSKLGLGREETQKLIDLLTDQQMSNMEQARRRVTQPGENALSSRDARQQQLAEVAELIGHDKVELFKEYQETLPARQEVATLARQLEGADLELSDQQRDRLVTALAEERKRVPPPESSQASSPEEFATSLANWQEDYQQRAASRARSILNTDQMAAYGDYQQWSRDMRRRFEARPASRGMDGNVVMAEPVTIVAPVPPPQSQD